MLSPKVKKNLKIGQHLPMLWAIKYRVVFYETRCIGEIYGASSRLSCIPNLVNQASIIFHAERHMDGANRRIIMANSPYADCLETSSWHKLVSRKSQACHEKMSSRDHLDMMRWSREARDKSSRVAEMWSGLKLNDTTRHQRHQPIKWESLQVAINSRGSYELVKSNKSRTCLRRRVESPVCGVLKSRSWIFKSNQIKFICYHTSTHFKKQ